MTTEVPDKAALADQIFDELAANAGDPAAWSKARADMRAALAAALPHMGGEPVAWRWRWKGHRAWHYGTHSANLVEPGDFQPLYLAPPASPDVAALIEAARAMSRKLATINGHSATQRVYTLAYLHGEPYDGPTYEAELLALDAALSRLSQPGGRDE